MSFFFISFFFCFERFAEAYVSNSGILARLSVITGAIGTTEKEEDEKDQRKTETVRLLGVCLA